MEEQEVEPIIIATGFTVETEDRMELEEFIDRHI